MERQRTGIGDNVALARRVASKIDERFLPGNQLLEKVALKWDMGMMLDYFVATEEAGILFLVMDSKEKILSCNRAMEAIAGCKAADIHGKYLWDIFMPLGGADAACQLECENHSFTRIGSSIECESQIITCNGAKKYIVWRGSRFYEKESGAECVAMIGLDMTTKKNNETGFYKRIKQITHSQFGSPKLAELGNDENNHRLVSYTLSGI